MTEKNPAVFLQAGSHPAEDVRRMFGALVFDTASLCKAPDLLVSATGSGLQISVAGGRAFIPGTESTYQGTYFVENRGATNLTHDPSDASNTRIDLVVAKVQDQSYSGAVNAWSLAIVKGTAVASNPAAPAAPANSIVLAQVAITAGLSSLTSTQITDRRPAVMSGVPDTGWVAVPAVSGYTSTVMVRNVGAVTMFKGVISKNSGSFPTAATTVATLPAGFSPVSEVRRAMSGFVAETAPFNLQIQAGSTQVVISNVGPSSGTPFFTGLVYPNN